MIKHKKLTALALGLTTSLLQLLFCYWGGGHPKFADFYHSLANWDGEWYEHIARVGYVSVIPPVKWNSSAANVAFFPGLPWIARAVAFSLNITHRTALVFTSQFFAVAFWSFLYLIVQQWVTTRKGLLAIGVLVAMHPASFFLQAGYSESLFLTSLLAFIYFSLQKPAPILMVLMACSFGILMTATRIVGAPLAFIGILGPARIFKGGLIGSVSCLGIAGFFLMCQYRWGHWNLYMLTQRLGWDITPNYLAIFSPRSWTYWHLNDWWPSKLGGRELGQVFTSLYLLFFYLTFVAEMLLFCWGVQNLKTRAPYYLAAFGLMFISVSGLWSVEFQSMLRYTFPVHVCWVIGLTALFHEIDSKYNLWTRLVILTGLALSPYFFLAQLTFIPQFTHWGWVAKTDFYATPELSPPQMTASLTG